MEPNRRFSARWILANTLQTIAVLGVALVTVAACGSSVKCGDYVIALCGNDGIKVNACGSSLPITADSVSKYLDNPPAYMDVAPMYAKQLLQFPDNIETDPSFATNINNQTLNFKVTPDNFGGPAPDSGGFDAVGSVTWSGGTGSGALIDGYWRVFVTSAHVLLDKNEDASADLSKRVFKVYYEYNSKGQRASRFGPFEGWGFVHPMYDSQTRAYDVGFVVLPKRSGLSGNGVRYSLAADASIDESLRCSCPIDPFETMIIATGEGNEFTDPPQPPPNPFLAKSYNFAVSNTYRRRLSPGELLGYDSFTLPDGSRVPTIEVWNEALFAGDTGAPLSSVFTDPSWPPWRHNLFGVYSGPSTVHSRRFTRMTTATNQWIKDMLVNGNASYPPLDWNGQGDHTSDPAYAFDPPSEWANPTKDNVPGDLHCDPPEKGPPSISSNFLDGIVILGDSLSDQQNQWNNGVPSGKPSFFTPSPGNGYFKGRFTNGYNWVDYFEQDYPNVKVTNLAVGGAFASDLGKSVLGGLSGPVAKLARPTIMDEYSANEGAFDGDVLAVIMIGGNDVFEAAKVLPKNGISVDSLSAAIVSSVKAVVDKLKAKGVRRFVFGALPPINSTPSAYSGKAGLNGDFKKITFAKAVVGRSNAEIRALANTMHEQGKYAASFVDIASFLGAWQTAGTYDLGDYPRPEDNVGMYETGSACADQDSLEIGSPAGVTYNDKPCRGYLFFDTLHPTTLAHCLMSQFFEANAFANANVNDIHVPAGPAGSVMSPKDLFMACITRPQNETWTDSWISPPYTDVRRTRFYYQASGAMDRTTYVDACSSTSACPSGYLWDDEGTDLFEDLTPFDEPGWIDLETPFTSRNIPGSGRGELAMGWFQPHSGWPSATRGACRCAPANDYKDLKCGSGPCASPDDIKAVMNIGSCRKVMYWSGFNGTNDRDNVLHDASKLSKDVGAVTLEDTVASLAMPTTWGAAEMTLWIYASDLFAANACPDPVYVAVGGNMRRDNVWRKVECPRMTKAGTTKASYFEVTNLPGSPTTTKSSTPIECALDCDSVPTAFNMSCAPTPMIYTPPAPGITNQN